MKHATLLIAALLVSTGPAAADPDPDRFGLRVGGYAFRAPGAPESERWSDCPMNGMGLFAQRALGGLRFLEAGLDLYTAAPEVEGMDRMSTLATVAGGLRMFPGARVQPYVQLGVGLEVTRVAMLSGADHHGGDTFVLPLGFFGGGADVGLGAHLRLGMNARAYLMGHFAHGGADHAMEPEAEAAMQVQFYAAYSR